MIKLNENRPGYKKTKVGWIPEKWECVLGKILFSNSSEMGFEGLPIYSITIDSGVVFRNTLERKMPNAMSPKNSLLVRMGDIAYNMMRAWQGAFGLIKKEGVISPAYIVLRPKKGVHSPFMYHLFKSSYYLYYIKTYSYGITEDRLRLYYKDFCVIPILCPPFDEQERIAEVLSIWDYGIQQMSDLIKLKERRKRALMQQLLTGHKRFSEFKNYLWRKVHLGEVFRERNEINRADLPLLSITGERGVIKREELDKKDNSTYDKTKYKRIAPEDIGYNTMRMWQGVSSVSELEGIVSPAYTICIPHNDIDPYFMGYLFKYPPIIYLFYRYSQGLVKDTLNLKFHNFSEIKVSIPSKEEQIKISKFLKLCDKEIKCLSRELESLKNQKQGLMQKLLTGQIRVKV